jgi:hypothetical protein
VSPQTVDTTINQVMGEFFIIFIPLILVWAICVWVTSKLADMRGRSRTRWTTRAALMGPVAVLWILVMPSRKEETERDIRERERRKRRRQRERDDW